MGRIFKMIMTRMNRIVKAYIHEGLEKLEDPVVLVKQYMRDMQEDMRKLDVLIEKHMRLDRSLAKDWKLAKELADRREEQAKVALAADKEDLARLALVSKKEAIAQIERYEQLREKNNLQLSERKQELAQLKLKYKQLRDRKLELILRVQAVKANEEIKQMKQKYEQKGSSIENEFERMEERVGDLEWKMNEVDASQLSKEDGYSNEIQAEIERLKEEKE